MKKVVLFVEGEGEAEAAPRLVSRIVTELNGWDAVTVDPATFRVGNLAKVSKNGHAIWQDKLQASLKRQSVGGILLLLDGDAKQIGGEPFCAMECAIELAAKARDVGGGSVFSTAVVFACQEFESWFIAAAAGFDGLPGGRRLKLPTTLPPNPETSPRDAKGWLRSVVAGGYRPTRDQAVFAEALNLKLLRELKVRSFARLEHAVSELINACRSGTHFVSPAP